MDKLETIDQLNMIVLAEKCERLRTQIAYGQLQLQVTSTNYERLNVEVAAKYNLGPDDTVDITTGIIRRQPKQQGV